MKRAIPLSEIAQMIGAELRGDASLLITGIAPIATAQTGQVTYLDKPRYHQYLANTQATAVIMAQKYAKDCPVAALIYPNPYAAYAKVSHLFNKMPTYASGIHPSAVIDSNCQIHPSTYIGPQVVVEEGVVIAEGCKIGAGCFIGANSRIGKDTQLWPRVTLYYATEIGERCIIHSGAIIGSDGFGLAFEKNEWIKIAQLGRVLISSDVEIGANTTIDRGTLSDTTIGKGVKIDNQVHIAHNVQIGEHTAIAGCVGIAGSAQIGKHCMIAGGVGIVGHIRIADQVTITGMSLVSHSLTEAGVYSSGTVIESNRTWKKNAVYFRQLDSWIQRIKKLEGKVEKS